MAAKTPVAGKIVWHDLVTTDVDKSMKFYKDLLGWDYTQADMGPGGPYNMIQAGKKTIGGFVEPENESTPAHWSAYVNVDDVDNSVATIKSHGGKVAVEPTDIPKVGRFAAGIDPEGAVLCVFKGNEPESPDLPKPSPKEFCWDELTAANPEAAADYYHDLFNWSFHKSDMGQMGPYWTAMRGEFQTAGIMKTPPDSKAPPHWMTYVYVDNLDATTKKVAKLGGKVLLTPTALPDTGRIAIIQDNMGAVVGLFGDPVNF